MDYLIFISCNLVLYQSQLSTDVLAYAPCALPRCWRYALASPTDTTSFPYNVPYYLWGCNIKITDLMRHWSWPHSPLKNDGSWLPCGCSLTHKTLPNIASYGLNPLMSTALPNGINGSACPMDAQSYMNLGNFERLQAVFHVPCTVPKSILLCCGSTHWPTWGGFDAIRVCRCHGSWLWSIHMNTRIHNFPA